MRQVGRGQDGEKPARVDVTDVAEMVDHAIQAVRDHGFARPGESILISAGMPFGTPGATNLLRIAQA